MDLPFTILSSLVKMNQHDRQHHTVGRLPILIDGFRFHKPSVRVEAYFLSHFHSDHYGGLDEQFPWTDDGALLYCSEVTAALAVNVLGVHPKHVRAQRFGERFTVSGPGLAGVYVTLVPANHCPGAAMLLFELADGKSILHCGDMRFDPSITRYPSLVSVVQRPGGLDDVLLDTTYAHAKHVFAGQSESVDEILAAVRLYLQERATIPQADDPPSSVAGVTSPFSTTSDAQLPPAKRQRKAKAGALSAAGVGLHMKPTISENDNSKFALSASDIGMRDGCAGDVQGTAASASAAPGNGADTPAVLHSSPAEGGGQYQWVNDGPWGRGWQALYPDSAPIPTQEPTHVPGMGMSRRFSHLQPPADGSICDSEDTLFLVCTYATGKERILVGIMRSLHMRVYMSSRKLRMAELIGLPAADIAWLTEEKTEASVHVVGMHACGRNFPYFQPNWQGLLRYMDAANARHKDAAQGQRPACLGTTTVGSSSAGVGETDDSDEADLLAAAASAPTPAADTEATTSAGSCSQTGVAPGAQAQAEGVPPLPHSSGQGRYKRIVGIVPTGWVHSSKKRLYTSPCGRAVVHLVPYSEHSSYAELCAFLAFLRPARITPTVYADGKDCDRIKALFAMYVNQTAAKKAFFSGFGKANGTGAARAVTEGPAKGADAADVVEVDEESHGAAPLLPQLMATASPASAFHVPISPQQRGPASNPGAVSSAGPLDRGKQGQDEDDIVEVLDGDGRGTMQAPGSLDTACIWKCHACLHSWERPKAVAGALAPLVACIKCGSGFIERGKLKAEPQGRPAAAKINAYFSAGSKR